MLLGDSKDQDMELLNVSKLHIPSCEISFSPHQYHLAHRCVTEIDIYTNHGGVLVNKFIDDTRQDSDTAEQEKNIFELLSKLRMGDDDMSSLVRVSIRDIKQNYFWLSVDCGDVKNLVLRKWQQNNDVKHNERSNECSFFFAPERLMWVRDLMLSPWRLICVLPLTVSHRAGMRIFPSMPVIHSNACKGKEHSDLSQNASKEYKFCDGWRLILRCMTFHVSASVVLLGVDPTSVWEFPCVIAFGMEESEFLCTPLACQPFVLLPYMFKTASRRFMYATGLQWGTNQERLRVMCILIPGSYNDVTNSLVAEVFQLVRPMWLMGISRFSPFLLPRLRYSSFQHFMSNISLVRLIIRIEAEVCAIHIGSKADRC